jgi:hypothetical protein
MPWASVNSASRDARLTTISILSAFTPAGGKGMVATADMDECPFVSGNWGRPEAWPLNTSPRRSGEQGDLFSLIRNIGQIDDFISGGVPGAAEAGSTRAIEWVRATAAMRLALSHRTWLADSQ